MATITYFPVAAGGATAGTGITNTAGTWSVDLSTGLAGGLTVTGGTAASENLTLRSTSNVTKGKVLCGASMWFDEANARLIAPTVGTESGDLVLRANAATFVTLQAAGHILLSQNLKFGAQVLEEPSANNGVLDTPSSGNAVRAMRRFYQTQGAAIASAATITLGTDGNYFRITGTTGISAITVTGWNAGSVVILSFAGALTITHGTGAAAIRCAGSVNISITAESQLTLVFDGTLWRETARAIA